MMVRFIHCGAGDNSPYAQEPCEVESLKHGFVAEVRRETASPTVTGQFWNTLIAFRGKHIHTTLLLLLRLHFSQSSSIFLAVLLPPFEIGTM